MTPEIVQIKDWPTLCTRVRFGNIPTDRLSAKVKAKQIPENTEVLVKCDLTGQPLLHGGHYSIYSVNRACSDPQ